MPRKAIRCYCGFMVAGEDGHIVPAMQFHALSVHEHAVTSDQVLAMAEPVAE
jgi:hypothetical protein